MEREPDNQEPAQATATRRPFPIGILALCLFLFVQCWWFADRFAQPNRYDAAEYLGMADRLEFRAGVPTLELLGFRSYAYPLILKPFVSALSTREATVWVHRFQCLLTVTLLLMLRYRLLPRRPAVDALLIVVLAALPVMMPYCVVVLSDSTGVFFLQTALWTMVAATTAPDPRRRWLLWLPAGALLGFAIQLRPAYFHLLWPALAFVLWAGSKWDSQARSASWSAAAKRSTLFAIGLLIACAPTTIDQWRAERTIRLAPDQSSLLSYHLTLGLWLDRWSSNPPPLAQLHAVALEWEKRGWQLPGHDPKRLPSFDDFRREAMRRPGRLCRQWFEHVRCAFAKSELFPYEGAPGPWWEWEIRWFNWLLLAGFLAEALLRARRAQDPFDRRFACWQLLLFVYLVSTLAPVVPEERHTLAIYPVALIYFTGLVWRLIERQHKDALQNKASTRAMLRPK